MKHCRQRSTLAYRLLLAGALVLTTLQPLAGPPASLGAAPPDAPPTPTLPVPPTPPPEPGVSSQEIILPSPDNIPPEVDQARARQAMGAALAKYLRYWGPRYQVAPVEIEVEGEWAHGVARWQSQATTLQEPIHLLARRQPDGSWQALLPGGDGLYRQWVEAAPESLVPSGEKSQLRAQGAEAEALQKPVATPGVPSAATSMPPGKEGRGEPVESIPGLAQPTATPTPIATPIGLPPVTQLSEYSQWSVYRDQHYGFAINYPSDWKTTIALVNQGKGPEVIEQRLLFVSQLGTGVNIDIFPNSNGLDLQSWFNAYQARFIAAGGIVQKDLVVAGEPAIYSLELSNAPYPPRHTVVLLHNDYAYRIEYQAGEGGLYLDIYRGMLESFELFGGIEKPDQLFNLNGADVQPQEIIAQDQDCCGYHDPNYNPYPCSSGNCTWWARFKRADTGGQSYPYWNDARNWTSRAAEEGFTVNTTPATGALGATPRTGYVRPGWDNHVAYIESFDGKTINFSDMDYGEFNCSVDYWGQSAWSGIEFIHNKGGTCSTPSLNSPSDGYVHTSSDRTITFNWSSPSNCTPDGYTFRVKTVPDMNSGGTTIFDEGQGGSQVTKQFGSEWERQDLYWSVRACKPCTPYNPGPWAPSRRFRIEPGTPQGNWEAGYDQGDTCWWDPNCNMNPRCTETINGPELRKDWNSGAPCSGMSGDNWVGDFRATVNFPPGEYVFHLDHDDGVKLWLNGQNIQDRGGSGSGPVCNGQGGYTLNGNVNLRVLLREQNGDAHVNLTWSTDPSVCQSPSPPSGNWQVTYYNDTNLSSQCSTASLDGTFVFRDWGDDTPASGCNTDNWSARFTRRVHFQSGAYTFGLGSDDWGRIKVGSDTVVNNWQGAGQHYESRTLSEGDYDVTVEFADTAGAARLAAWWWGPGFDIPRQSRDPSQWYAQYWGNKELWWDSIVRVNEGTGRLAHSWDTGGPGYGLLNDRFSSRFERRVHFDCGRYRFHIFTDDGVRFWIDGQQRLDEWVDGVNSYDVYVDLSAGYHNLRLEHYENGGSAAISLDWFMESGCVPYAPSNLNATAVSQSQINLTWTDNSSVETGFNIYRGGSYIGQVGANVTAYQDTGLDCGTSYSYHVTAYNSTGESNPSDTASANTQECAPSLPDLRPYAPSGYPYPIVPSSVQGTHTINTLYAGQPTYFDWYFTNSGTAVAPGTFYVELWVDGTRYVRYPCSNYGVGLIGGFDDWMETITAPGWHTVRLITDPDGTVEESDETNNVWEHQFYWTPTAPYSDNMENGANGWTATGLWNQVSSSSPYPGYRSPAHSWWYGQDATGDYDTGAANSGDLTSPSIYIPTGGYYLRFWYRYETETQSPDWDQRWVQISVDGGPFNNVLQLYDDPMNEWLQSPAISLSGYAGHTIQVRFHFDTIDDAFNTYRGWYIDDFDISSTPPPSCADSYEPNNTPALATTIAYGQSRNADICPGGDYDFYRFTGTAGDRVVVDIDAKTNGSLLDSYVFLLDSDGASVLAENDDEILVEVQDSHFGYQLPHDGTYYIKVRAWDHPSVGGTGYFYTIRLLTDNTDPSSAAITSPGNDTWLDLNLETITVSASDNQSGISHVAFLWHAADWQASDWVWLGEDWDGRNGWSWDFDTSGLAEQRGGAFYIWAFDWAGNWTGAGTWNLGIDRTSPTAGADVSPMYGDAPFLDFYVWWSGSDNLSGVASYDVQYRDGPNDTWTNLLAGTTDTYYRFIGQDGHTYYFRARARDQAGNLGTYASNDGDVQHTVQICATAADANEPDNSYTAARTMATDGTWQSHNFHDAGDPDWTKFTATTGITYTLTTTNTGGHADTMVSLYGPDGTTLLAFNDDDPENWPASRLAWGATRDDTYYVKVEHWDPYAYGCTTAYDLSIAETGTFEVSNEVFLPIILRNGP